MKSGAPGGTRTPDLLVCRGISHHAPTHAVQQEPMKSAREGTCFRLASDGSVPRSRTITRTTSMPFCVCWIHGSRFSSGTDLRCRHWYSGASRVRHNPDRNRKEKAEAINLRPLGFPTSRKSSQPTRKHVAPKLCNAAFWCSPTALPSDCLPDVPLQLLEFVRVARDCPCLVRVSESSIHAS